MRCRKGRLLVFRDRPRFQLKHMLHYNMKMDLSGFGICVINSFWDLLSTDNTNTGRTSNIWQSSIRNYDSFALPGILQWLASPVFWQLSRRMKAHHRKDSGGRTVQCRENMQQEFDFWPISKCCIDTFFSRRFCLSVGRYIVFWLTDWLIIFHFITLMLLKLCRSFDVCYLFSEQSFWPFILFNFFLATTLAL